jgi:hypothetical protein
MRLFDPKLACAAILASAALVAAPAAAPAFQNVTLENGGTTLHIVGDAGKTTDLVTIKYDSATNEYVITHDILTAPPGCRFEGNGPPYKLLRCPAKGIEFILVDTGAEADRFVLQDMIATNLLKDGIWYPPDLLEVVVFMGLGNDKYEETSVQPPALPPAEVVAKRSIDMGGGNDGASVGPGESTVVFGDGNAKLLVSGGTNAVTAGNGTSKIELTGGTNTVKIGAGNSQVTAKGGTNSVRFNGAGANTYNGGPGLDTVQLGVGNDVGYGGGGPDQLFGGPGKDQLFGGAAYDLLNGGPGRPDRCYGGAGGAMPIGCEIGVQYMP